MTAEGDKNLVANSPASPPSLAVAKELFAGTIGGTAQICVGHPFDTVKVKLQSMKQPKPGQPPMYTGAMDVVRKVVAREGVRGLFAGIQAPLPFVAVFNATLFASNGTMRRVLGKGRTEDQLSIAEIGLAGVGAGVAVSFVACPTELVKCRLQAQPGAFAGAIDCTRQVVANRGMSGLFTGMQATLIREMPGNALYFMTYVATQRSLVPQGGTVKDLSSWHHLLAGGMAGLGKLLHASCACCDVERKYEDLY
ncbi:carnitine/acylcarnitine translocase [Gracilaria domingensis]|nr:carnitine/acylcarnitine translocase [Gracilaria domingensis]